MTAEEWKWCAGTGYEPRTVVGNRAQCQLCGEWFITRMDKKVRRHVKPKREVLRSSDS